MSFPRLRSSSEKKCPIRSTWNSCVNIDHIGDIPNTFLVVASKELVTPRKAISFQLPPLPPTWTRHFPYFFLFTPTNHNLQQTHRRSIPEREREKERHTTYYFMHSIIVAAFFSPPPLSFRCCRWSEHFLRRQLPTFFPRPFIYPTTLLSLSLFLETKKPGHDSFVCGERS